MSILIVDDQPITAEPLTAYLTMRGYPVAGFATNTAQALHLCAEHHPSVVLLDVVLLATNDNGVKATVEQGLLTLQLLKTQFPTIKVIMLTNIDLYERRLSEVLHTCWHNGAQAFVHKAQIMNTLLSVIDQLNTKLHCFSPEQCDLIMAYKHKPNPLTAQEQNVLHLAANGKSAHEIAADLNIAVSTARKHFEHIATLHHLCKCIVV